MDNIHKLRLILRILRAVISVIEAELNRQIEKGQRNEGWMEKNNTDSDLNF